MMRAKLNRNIWKEADDYGPTRVVAYKGTEGDIEAEWNDPFTYVFWIAAFNKINVYRDEFDYIDQIQDLVDLVEEASRES